MLSKFPSRACGRPTAARQDGVVLLIALIVLVAMTLAGIGLIRSVDTANLIAGNLAFQQAATHAGDVGLERAIAVINTKSHDGTLNDNDTSNGYFATLKSTDNPAAGQSWDDFWAANLRNNAVDNGTDQFGNHVYFVIHRQCANALSPTSGGQCVASPRISVASGNSEEAGDIQFKGNSQVYYRITVRIAGPRNTVSYVQAFVSL